MPNISARSSDPWLRAPSSPLAVHLRDNIEAYLTAVGVAVAFLVPVLLHAESYWKTAAITALAVSVIHGAIFWQMRRRQRMVRAELIGEMREMLTDRINNELAVVMAAITADTATGAVPTEADAAHLSQAIDATRAISYILRELSSESLKRWHERYGHSPS